jgi:hypothetical protein
MGDDVQDEVVRKDVGPMMGDFIPGSGQESLGELKELRLAGVHLSDGVDIDEHVRDLREGWEELKVPDAGSNVNAQERLTHLTALLEAKGIGVEMARGIDLDEHLRQVREGWDEDKS